MLLCSPILTESVPAESNPQQSTIETEANSINKNVDIVFSMDLSTEFWDHDNTDSPDVEVLPGRSKFVGQRQMSEFLNKLYEDGINTNFSFWEYDESCDHYITNQNTMATYWYGKMELWYSDLEKAPLPYEYWSSNKEDANKVIYNYLSRQTSTGSTYLNTINFLLDHLEFRKDTPRFIIFMSNAPYNKELEKLYSSQDDTVRRLRDNNVKLIIIGSDKSQLSFMDLLKETDGIFIQNSENYKYALDKYIRSQLGSIQPVLNPPVAASMYADSSVIYNGDDYSPQAISVIGHFKILVQLMQNTLQLHSFCRMI